MSERSVDGQESEAVPCYHDQSPQYYPSQPSQDLLTSIIETEHIRRILKQRQKDVNEEVEKLRRKMSTNSSYLMKGECCQEIGQKCRTGTDMY
jgi:hypothetical protein